MLCALYTSYLIPQIYGQLDSDHLKANELSSVMTVCIYGFHNDVTTYMLQIGESTIHKIFGA